MPVSFTFNGVKKDYLRVLVGLERPAWAPIEEEILEIPGRPGGIITKQHTTVRRLNIPVRVYKRGFNSLEELEEDLAAWLVTDDPKPLEFDHKPERVYYAKVTGELIFTEYPQWADGVISFICPDPYKYGPELVVEFPSDAVSLRNNGTAEALPVFELEAKEPVTFAMIQNQDNEYMMIGRPQSVDKTPKQELEIILNTDMSSTVGWTTGSYVDGGTVSGEMKSNGYAFYASDYGSGTDWHGPALMTSLSEELDDFVVEALVELSCDLPQQVGRVEIYLMDASKNVIAKMELYDASPNYEINYAWLRIGDYSNAIDLVHEHSDNWGGWNKFYGVLKLARKNGQWYAYVSKVDKNDGHHYYTRIIPYRYFPGFDSKKLAIVEVHIGAHSSYVTPNLALLHELTVWKINSMGENEIPYIAQEGDIIIFDHKNKDIRINGESRKDLKDFGASFFKLKKGDNQLIVLPSDSFEVKCKYRERYL